MAAPLFVYGSLRPGECNYHHLSAGVLQAETVSWPGQLYLRPEGYPALCLPQNWPVKTARPGDWNLPTEACPELPEAATEVVGTLLWLSDDAHLQQHLDNFEGFTPVDPDYLRVAVAFRGQWCWTYISPDPAPSWPCISSWPPADSAASRGRWEDRQR